MIDIKGLEAIAKHLAPVIRETVNREVESRTDNLLTIIDKQKDIIKSMEEKLSSFSATIESFTKNMQEVLPDIEKQVDSFLKSIPTPDNGKDGVSVEVNEVLPVLEKQVQEYLATIPIPKDGKDVDIEVIKSLIQEEVKKIPTPKDGVSPTVEEIADRFERRFSELTLHWERKSVQVFEKAIDSMPKPKDGKDAISLEDFDMELNEDGRSFSIKMKAGDVVYEKTITLPTIIDRGVFNHSIQSEYRKGDAVTYGGSLWIVQKDNPKGVPSGSDDFRLAVKRGRDGKDLRTNASQYIQGTPVKIGESK